MPETSSSCRYVCLSYHSYFFSQESHVNYSGRVEFRALLVTYLVSLILQLVTAGALLEQGTQAIGALTAIHAGIVASLFWVVLWNAFTTTQLLDDGRPASLMVSPPIRVLVSTELEYLFSSCMQANLRSSSSHCISASIPPLDSHQPSVPSRTRQTHSATSHCSY